ncbi:putative Phosphoribosyltransferase [Nitrospira japonica]|uniref:Putative Phosphoribosyltransferase n=1 Tax=Nitrospira japonica TaxID=1325564 RepID=A0A1W1I2M6_9BACT|nr:phosphoribosyltransferase family protein [Nitrospira japonica]SLM47257.1 putative Phosphoribosyltransferase [Nitrospira japonica]
MTKIFRDREEAGYRLGQRLLAYRDNPDGLVFALPRGGVIVGYQLSLALHLPLEVFIACKVGSPENPEYALGAITEMGNLHMNPIYAGDHRRLTTSVEELAEEKRAEILRRRQLYRQGRSLLAPTGRLAILVDDGIATGATFLAAVEALREQAPSRLVAALPVGPAETVEQVRGLVDELVVLACPEPFWSVGTHYADFSQINDEEVLTCLDLANARHDGTVQG